MMIRFLRQNPYGKRIGDTTDLFPEGVVEALVRRGVAEIVEEPVTAAVISEPVAESKPKRKYTRRKKQEIEA